MRSALRLLLAFAALAGAACAPAPYEPPTVEPMEGDVVTKVEFSTTKGDFVVEAHSAWAPKGAARFLALVGEGFYDGCRFYRVLPDFVVQWGISGDAERNKHWEVRSIPDDPRKVPNARGTLSFAAAGRDTRTTMVFVNMADNSYRLDLQGFTPFARVLSGFDVIASLEAKHENAPLQREYELMRRGNDWIDESFPDLDHVKTARVVE